MGENELLGIEVAAGLCVHVIMCRFVSQCSLEMVCECVCVCVGVEDTF